MAALSTGPQMATQGRVSITHQAKQGVFQKIACVSLWPVTERTKCLHGRRFPRWCHVTAYSASFTSDPTRPRRRRESRDAS
jgi:hypothetical protein